jgi:hypothetical protein
MVIDKIRLINDYRSLLGVAKKIIPKKTLKKVNTIKDRDEKYRSLVYLVTSRLEIMIYELERTLNKLKMEKKDTMIIEMKKDLLVSKVRYFNASHEKKDFKNLFRIYNEINKEVKKIV